MPGRIFSNMDENTACVYLFWKGDMNYDKSDIT